MRPLVDVLPRFVIRAIAICAILLGVYAVAVFVFCALMSVIGGKDPVFIAWCFFDAAAGALLFYDGLVIWGES